MPTRIADIYEPEPYGRMINEKQLELNRYFGSGIMIRDAEIETKLSSGGRTVEFAGFKPIENVEPNISNDDPNDFAVPNKAQTQKLQARSADLNQAWSNMDLATQLSLPNPEEHIIGSIAGYWRTANERRLIHSTLGVLNANALNNQGDMQIDIALDDPGQASAAEKLNKEVVIEAAQTMGDHKDGLNYIVMHSRVNANLAIVEKNSFDKESVGDVKVPTYLGMRVIIDDSMPAIQGTNRLSYLSVVFAPSAFGYGEGYVKVPSEYERVPLAGKGGGQENLISRENVIIHPYGFKYTDAVRAGDSTSLAELQNAANWERVWLRKHIGMAFITTNG